MAETSAAEIVVANFILPLVKDLVQPKISQYLKNNKEVKASIDKITDNLTEYLSKRYEKYTVVDTLVFPNKQILFDVIYEPLSVISIEPDEKVTEILIDTYPETFLPEYHRVIVEDTAGMGKSTITRKLFRSAIEKNIGIPVLIELRHIKKSNSILKEITNQLSPLGRVFNIETILKFLNEGDFIFLFDGFDEISIADRDFVINDLHRFIEKANNNHFLITSRPEDSLRSFGDFATFSIKNLSKKQAYRLIKRYDTYSHKSISDELIDRLRLKKEDSLDEYLKNPLLVSLLFKSFDFKKDIPLKKTQFYRQVFDALFESHDLSKEGYLKRDKYSNLHLDDFDKVLRHLAFLTAKENKVEYDRNVVLHFIENAKKFTPELSFKSSDYLRDLLETVPLFKKDGNYIKWAHKSLQDFFAAKFLWVDAKEHQEKILRRIYDDKDNSRFFNLLDLFWELDPKTVEKTVLYWLLEDYKKYADVSYKEMRKAGTVDIKIIENRLGHHFNKVVSIVCGNSPEYEVLDHEKVNVVHNNHIVRFKLDPDLVWRCVDYFYFKKPKCTLFSYIFHHTNIETILQLLSIKEPSLATKVSHNSMIEDLLLLDFDRFYTVDDKPDNILNSAELFELTTKLIISGYYVNHANALLRLRKIKKALSKKTDNDLFEW